MAKLSGIKRILKEQLPSAVQQWVDQLIIPLNNAVSQFTYALTNQLTITDNFQGAVKTFTLKNSDYPFTFQHGLAVRPKVCFLGQVLEDSGSPALFTAAPYAQWEPDQSGTQIVLRQITGLNASKTYFVTLVILAE